MCSTRSRLIAYLSPAITNFIDVGEVPEIQIERLRSTFVFTQAVTHT
jgi:hypothetical protein